MSLRNALRIQLLITIVWSSVLPASEVSFFRMQSREDFLEGTLDGISVDSFGQLSLANRGRRMAEFPEPFLFSAAGYRGGWVVGTGNSGAVFHVKRDGTTERLFSAEEPEIFALWADPDGTVFAGSSPDGKVYKISSGTSEVFFEPQETYIWAITRARDGALLVATGTEGRLYRVDSSGEGELLFDSDDTHLRSLAVLPDGDVLAGTAGEGLVLRIAPDGRARTLYDGEAPEVVDFAIAGDGTAYVAVQASEASLTDSGSRRGGSQTNGQSQQEGGGSVRVTVSPANGQGEESTGSRPRGFKGPRSEILKISPTGAIETVWQFEEETVYALAWQNERLWAGTGLDGKIYSLRRGRMVLEKDVEERQIVALLEDSPGPAFATTNAAAFYRISDESESAGTYTSPTLDAGQASRFGSLRWRGEERGGVRFSARSGVSSKPDRTWSEWTEAQSGGEISLKEVPSGRFLQWRAELTANGGSPSLTGVDVSYQQVNLPPRVQSLEVLDPGEIVVPTGFNPSNQVYEPAHPNRDGIFTPLRGSKAREERRRSKTLWKKGYRTLKWEVEDPNADELHYELSFQRVGEGDAWLEMASEIDDDSYSFDATALPDGYYRFRLRALDRQEGELEAPLVGEEQSAPVLIDHSVPELLEVRSNSTGYRVVAGDSANPLRGAEVSVDAGEWRPLRPEDGLLDGKRETLAIQAPGNARLVLLRLTDAAFNVVTYDLRQESR